MGAVALDEYALGVDGGKVVSQDELDASGAMLAEARKQAMGLSTAVRVVAVPALDSVIADSRAHKSAEDLRRRFDRMKRDLERTLGAALDLLPAAPPSLARGAHLFKLRCQEC